MGEFLGTAERVICTVDGGSSARDVRRYSRFVKEDELLIIWVGRLVPEKRPDVWRDVVKRLHEEGRPVKGMVVGVGPCQNMFEGMSYVTVKGWLSGMALAEAYASSDILLFPSDVETFGNVTLEALACGVPSVVSTCSCSQKR